MLASLSAVPRGALLAKAPALLLRSAAALHVQKRKLSRSVVQHVRSGNPVGPVHCAAGRIVQLWVKSNGRKDRTMCTANAQKKDTEVEGQKKASSSTDVTGEPLDSFSISDVTKSRLKSCGITHLFPVQAKTFSALMAGKDMVVRSRTGSGKTIAFALPVIEKLIKEDHSSRGRRPRCMVLAPTRELAMQISREFERIAPQLSTVCIYGGASYVPQESALRAGIDVVIGTPGRVIDHMNKGTLHLDKVKFFILDEADEMLKMGFQDDVETVVAAIPKEGRQTNLWSATMPRWVQDLAKRYCTNLEFLDMVGTSTLRTADTIRHVAIATSQDAKPAVIANCVRAYSRGGRVLIFAQTKIEVDALSSSPELKGTARVLHGDINQAQRERTLTDFREGTFPVLVATDVAARGIDVPEVEVVIQTSVAPDDDTFVHRSGRTGRAGRSGVNIVLYSSGDEPELLRLEKGVGMAFSLEGAPAEALVVKARMTEVQKDLDSVPQDSRALFMKNAEAMLATGGATAMAAALASLAGYGSGVMSAPALLSGRPGYVTILAELDAAARRRVRGLEGFRRAVQMCVDDGTMFIGRIQAIGSGYLFDVPTKAAGKLLGKDWSELRDAAATASAEAAKDGKAVLPPPAAVERKSEEGLILRLSVPSSLPPLRELVPAADSSPRGGQSSYRGRFAGGGGGGRRDYAPREDKYRSGGGGYGGGGGGYGGGSGGGGGGGYGRRDGEQRRDGGSWGRVGGSGGGSRGGGGWQEGGDRGRRQAAAQDH